MTAIVLEDYINSEQFALQSLVANPMDFTLLKNLAFARINQGDTQGAKEAMERISRLHVSERTCVVLEATRGLIAFRAGEADLGRRRYAAELSHAQRLRETYLSALASILYAFEELRHTGALNDSVVSAAPGSAQRVDDPSVSLLGERLSNAIYMGKRSRTEATTHTPPTVLRAGDCT